MDYPEALAFISATGRFGIKLGLERTRALLDALGAPDRGIRGVLVGGTNGKGSTCAYLVAMLREAGLRVGSMPKPHLQSYTERVQVDGRPISEADFAALMTRVAPAIARVARDHGDPTEFEMLTAAAVLHLSEQGIDALVCEVGMGGRLDSTNVLDLGVKVITSVDLDHQRYLGDTVEQIAVEKAGIIRAGDDVVVGRISGAAAGVIQSRLAEVGASAWHWGREMRLDAFRDLGWRGSNFDFTLPKGPFVGLETRMIGPHQAHNAILAVAACHALGRHHGFDIGHKQMRRGALETRWPGRLEVVPGHPRVVVDSGHNPAAVAAVVDAVTRLLADAPAPVVVFGAMADKDWAAMISLLPQGWPVVFTAVAEDRAQPAADLLAAARSVGRGSDEMLGTPSLALARARERAGAEGTILVLGSLYLAGEVRTALGL